jgi:hypothetical protein
MFNASERFFNRRNSKAAFLEVAICWIKGLQTNNYTILEHVYSMCGQTP